jgi:hypothetical protein
VILSFHYTAHPLAVRERLPFARLPRLVPILVQLVCKQAAVAFISMVWCRSSGSGSRRRWCAGRAWLSIVR